ncbi:MAG TPA: LysE family transporter [Candidatus Babeliales bacterium]|nr:LysE family transporter [Candidatus Babeliales bacterium]
MDISMILQGIMVGFSIAAPVGAIGLLCIQNTLSHGLRFGVICGLGAATADMMYGILVAVGMQSLATVMLNVRTPLSICGGLFLIYLGLKKFWAKPALQAAQIDHKLLFGAYVSTFFLTLTNPATILDFMALFTGLRIDVTGYTQGLNFVIGVFIGSAIWWLLLCGAVGIFRKKISNRLILWINYAAGIAICSFGIWALIKALL